MQAFLYEDRSFLLLLKQEKLVKVSDRGTPSYRGTLTLPHNLRVQDNPRGCTTVPVFSSPGQSPGRAGVGIGVGGGVSISKCSSFTLKFLCDGQGGVRQPILSL